jgi:hypothetical protein
LQLKDKIEHFAKKNPVFSSEVRAAAGQSLRLKRDNLYSIGKA